jgi:hypothetical protein
MEQERAELQREFNRAAARNALSPLGLTEKDITDEEFELFVSSDKARTESRIQYVVGLVKRREETARKEEREKVLKEQPRPPAGETAEPEDLFLQGFNTGKHKK